MNNVLAEATRHGYLAALAQAVLDGKLSYNLAQELVESAADLRLALCHGEIVDGSTLAEWIAQSEPMEG